MAKGIYVDAPTKRDVLKFLEYIESSGTQYIKTGIYHNADTCPTLRMVLDAEFGITSILLNGNGAANYQGFYVGVMSNYIYYSTHYGDVKTTLAYAAGKRYQYDLDNSTATFKVRDGEQSVLETSTTVGVPTGSKELYLFGYNTSDSGSVTYAVEKIYSAQIYVGDVLVRDYVPCQNASGEIGLYDKVNDQFYGNAGTGVFTAGSVVEEVGGDTIIASKETKMFFTDLTGVYRKIKKGFVTTADGVYRTFYSGGIDLPIFDGSYAIFGDESQGYIEMYASGTLTLSPGLYDVHLVGGGASGSGGVDENSEGYYVYRYWAAAGGTTTGFNLSAEGGKANPALTSGSDSAKITRMGSGSDGGSGGGAKLSTETSGRPGGSDGSAGGSWTNGNGAGAGQGRTTYDFQDPTWTLRAGGGGGGGIRRSSKDYDGGAGGAGGGGKGGLQGASKTYFAVGSGVANTGGGGGGNNMRITGNGGGGGGSGYTTTAFAQQLGGDYSIVIASGGTVSYGGAGGSGIAIVRWGY